MLQKNRPTANRQSAINRRGLVWLVLALAFMIFIFYKSSQTYQQQDIRPSLAGWLSRETMEALLPKVEFYYDKDFISWTRPYDMLEFFIRKAGHVTEYAVLTFLWVKTLLNTKLTQISALLFAGLISLLYAASDEWHQTFVPNRTGHPIDIGMDSVGILLVLLVTMFALRAKGRKAW